MTNYYIDYGVGVDANDGLGFYNVSYTGGSGTQPIVGSTFTGATSSVTFKMSAITVTSGTWVGNDGAGVLWFSGKSGTETASEQIDNSNGSHCHITGSTTTTAKKTVKNGLASTPPAAGDYVYFAKSPTPVKLSGATGHATWTNGSKTVTLTEAQIANITMCEANWTNVNGTSCARLALATDAKEGSYCVKIVWDGTPSANQVQAYSATGALDLSAYQEISLWIKTESGYYITDDSVEINLCTGSDGTGEVDTFRFPAIPTTANTWIPLVLTKEGGGNLSNNINSINISSRTNSYTASKYIYIDDIFACKTGGLNIRTLISKNTLEQSTYSSTGYGNEPWHPIQSINGTTVLIDNSPNSKADAGRGYSTTGTSPEEVDTYIRETSPRYLPDTTESTFQPPSSGTFSSYITYQGGVDKTTGSISGQTIIDDVDGKTTGFGTNSKSFNTIKNFSFVRCADGLAIATNCNKFENIYDANGCFSAGATISSYTNNVFINCLNFCNNGLQGITPGSYNGIYPKINTSNNLSTGTAISAYGNIFQEIKSLNNAGYGVSFSSSSAGNKIYNYISSSNVGNASYSGVSNVIYNATISDTRYPYTMAEFYDLRSSINNNGGYSYIYASGGEIKSQDATAGGTGKEWKMIVQRYWRDINIPLTLSLAKIAVVADKLVTVSVYFKKSVAGEIAADLVVKVGQITWEDGTSNVQTTCTDNTSRNSTEITFTPTEAGVIEIEAWAYATSTTKWGTPTEYANSTVDAGTKTKVTSAGHGLLDGDLIYIASTTSGQYDTYLSTTGYWTVSNKTTDTFDIDIVYGTNPTTKGTWTKINNVIVDDITITQAD